MNRDELPDIDIGCEFCYRRLDTTQELFRHVSQSHKEEKGIRWFGCDDCLDVFPDKASSEAHARDHHDPVLSLKCASCDLGFSTPEARDEHVANHHQQLAGDHRTGTNNVGKAGSRKSRMMDCRFCRESFNPNMIYQHANRIHGDEVVKSWLKCRKCSNYYPDQAVLDRHLYNHSRKSKAALPQEGEEENQEDDASTEKQAQQPSKPREARASTSAGKSAPSHGSGFPFCPKCSIFRGRGRHCHVNRQHRSEALKCWLPCRFCRNLYDGKTSLANHLHRFHKHVIQDPEVVQNDPDNGGDGPFEVKDEVDDQPGLDSDDEMDVQELDHDNPAQSGSDHESDDDDGVNRAELTFTMVLPRQVNEEPVEPGAILPPANEGCVTLDDANDDEVDGPDAPHVTRLAYVCMFCLAEYRDKKDLVRHSNRHNHVPKMWKLCQTCGQYNPPISRLGHKCAPPQNPFGCPFCQIVFDSREDQITHANLTHMKILRGSDWVTCATCLYHFPAGFIDEHQKGCVGRSSNPGDRSNGDGANDDNNSGLMTCYACKQMVPLAEFEAHLGAFH